MTIDIVLLKRTHSRGIMTVSWYHVLHFCKIACVQCTAAHGVKQCKNAATITHCRQLNAR